MTTPPTKDKRGGPRGLLFQPIDEERRDRARALLERGDSAQSIAAQTGIGRSTISQWRRKWLDDGSLVLPARGQQHLDRGNASRLGRKPPPRNVVLVSGGEGDVGASQTADIQPNPLEVPAKPAAAPTGAVVSEPLPQPGNVGEEPPAPPAAPPSRYEQPPDEDELFSLNDAGQVVVNVRFQLPVKHIAFKELLEDTGQIPRGINLNTWYVAGMDDYLTAMWGQRLGLVRYVEPPNSDGASPERVEAGAA